MALSSQQQFSRLVALFLGEVLRSRHTTLPRAAEISRRVVSQIEGLSSEPEVLSLVTELEREFGEVLVLKQALHFGYQDSDVKVYEREIKEYAAELFKRDAVTSSLFLELAAGHGTTIQELCVKYPDFCQYLLNVPEKGELVLSLQRQAA